MGTTGVMDLADRQVFTVTADVARTLSFTNVPSAYYSMTVVVRIEQGVGAITWPAGVKWAGGSAPDLNTAWTTIVFFWDGASWHGNKWGGEDL
jgi:hypothetical protein